MVFSILRDIWVSFTKYIQIRKILFIQWFYWLLLSFIQSGLSKMSYQNDNSGGPNCNSRKIFEQILNFWKFWINDYLFICLSVCDIVCFDKSWQKHFFFRIIEPYQVFSYFLRKPINYLILTSRDKNLTTLQYQFYKQCNA